MMDKLLDYLKEFYPTYEISMDNGLLSMENDVEKLHGYYAISYVVSRWGGFIEWLVDNDKIDLDKVADRMENRMWNDNSCDIANVLMNLAIKDEPLQYLIDILK